MTEDQDRCPHCHQAFEILVVRFAVSGARAVSRCPNCALSPVDQRASVPISRYRIAMLNALNNQFKSIIVASLAAVVVAGVLRHTLHVYGGISPEDIRSDSLLLVAAAGIVGVFHKVLRRG